MYSANIEEIPKSRLFSLGILPTALPAPPCYPPCKLSSNPEYDNRAVYVKPGQGVASAPGMSCSSLCSNVAADDFVVAAPRLKGGPGCDRIVRVGDM